MGKTNYGKYSPKSDSTPGITHDFDPDSTVVLKACNDGGEFKAGCPCGCGEAALSKGRTFGMGHDARYRGRLIRAHVAGCIVAHVQLDGKGRVEHSAVDTALAKAAEHGWERYLEAAKEREDAKLERRRDTANRALLAKASGPQVGDSKLIRVGRWEYTGQVIGIWDNGDTIEYRYVTKNGAEKVHTERKAQAGSQPSVKGLKDLP